MTDGRTTGAADGGAAARRAVALADRGVLSVGGEDARAFLQGLISNDMNRVAPDRAIYAALLNPKGRYLFEFHVVERDGAFLLDCAAARRDDLARRLALYRLRARVEIADASDRYSVLALIGRDAAAALDLAPDPGRARPAGSGVLFVDPRTPALGVRALLPPDAAEATAREAGFAAGAYDEYDRLRLRLGIPDGERDLVPEDSLPMECGFEALNALDWDKGCYVGQEVTARMRYRALVKKRLLPVAVEGPLPPPGTAILREGREVGEIRSGRDGRALALVRVAALDEERAEAGAPLTAGEATVRVVDASAVGQEARAG